MDGRWVPGLRGNALAGDTAALLLWHQPQALPVFTTTVGQVSKRLVEPGLDPESVPPLAVTLISHLHFDHLSLGSLSLLERYTGYVIQYHGLTVYFGGDTAYDRENVAATAARFPSIDLALLPIAPIHPRAHMEDKHIDPKEAVQIFQELEARILVPIHFGTFINSEDAPGEPIAALRLVAKESKLDPHALQVLTQGEQRVLIPRVAVAPGAIGK